MTTVVIAEKPDQARAYMDGLGIKYTGRAGGGKGATFLDQNTEVVSAAGHLIELCEPEKYDPVYKDRDRMDILPIIPGKFAYDIREEVKSKYFQIKNAIDHANRIIVATDKDNEGAAIAYNILLQARALKGYKQILRAYPSALNKEAVQRQFKHLEKIEPTWFQARAAIARSRSDWLIGMNFSRLYTHKLKVMGIKGNFAVGRAISTTLNLICQYNQEIEDFVEQPIYELVGKTIVNGQQIPLKSQVRIVGDGVNDPQAQFWERVKATGIQPGNAKYWGRVAKVEAKEMQKYPPVLMTKGDLYKEMARVAGWTQARSKKVMQLNYEQGYQTYPRTDSGKITPYMYDYLKRLFPTYLAAVGATEPYEMVEHAPEVLKRYFTSEASAGAHLAIIPTEKVMDSNVDVTDDQRLMYEVVVRKSLTLLLPPYRYVSNRLGVLVEQAKFMAQETQLLDQGWKKILLPSKKKRTSKAKQAKQPLTPGFNFTQYVKEGDVLPVKLGIDKGKTKPLPPLKSIQIYDKGGLMERAHKYVTDEKYAKILKEAKGIGTSATRDQAMQSLQDRGYVIVDNKDVITVTAAGWLMNWLLRDSQVNDPILTAKWEEEYSRIEKGTVTSAELINATAQLIYNEFAAVEAKWNVDEISNYYEQRKQAYEQATSAGKCPICGGEMLYHQDRRHKGKYDNYECNNDACKYRIYANYAGKHLSQKTIAELLAKGKTKVLRGFVTKDGKKYNGHLKLRNDPANNTMKLQVERVP